MAGRGDINKFKVQPIFSKLWLSIPLESAFRVISGYEQVKTRDSLEVGAYPIVDQGDKLVSGYTNSVDAVYRGELPVIIFGDHTRKIKYIDFDFVAGADGTKVLRPISLLDPKFFYYYMLSLDVPNLGYSRHYSILKRLDFPVLTLPEQERIANKLDILFAQIDNVRRATDRIPQLLKNLRQQILTHAVTGKLTAEWRNGNDITNEYDDIEVSDHREYEFEIPDSWVVRSFKDVVFILSNLVNPNDYLDLPLIAPDNIESSTGKLISKPFVNEINPISAKHYFSEGSVVYSKIRPYLSKAIYADFEGLCSADMYPLKSKINIHYLLYYILSSEFLSFATTAGERIVLPKINQKSLNIIPIPIPPKKEQEAIVEKVNALFAQLDNIEERYKRLTQKLKDLPQSLLHKAFKGELVPQLPTDGSAADLLKEIELLRNNVTKNKHRK